MIRQGSRLPVGVDSFRNLIETDCTFVDKTLLIKEVVSAPDTVSLILRPRRFGKSTNLDMLRYLKYTLVVRNFTQRSVDTFLNWSPPLLQTHAAIEAFSKACRLRNNIQSFLTYTVESIFASIYL
jgi:hypothetical protein